MTDERRNELATGAPGAMQLGGVTYFVGQPTDQDLAAIRQYLRGRLQSPLAAVADELAHLPPAQRALVQESAIRAAVEMKAAGGVRLTEDYVNEQLRQPHGLAFLAWTLIRHHHPDVALEAIRPHITEQNADAVLVSLYEESGMKDVSEGKAGGRPASVPGT